MTFFINNDHGYTVMAMDADSVPSVSPVKNFGDRQGDAIEFRNDCRNGVISESRIRLMIRTYTNIPYKYLGKGNCRKNKDE